MVYLSSTKNKFVNGLFAIPFFLDNLYFFVSNFCIQIAACVFSVFGLSIIQQLTPDNMIGKVMAYTATFSLCAQPVGQIFYGMLFDKFSNMVYVVLIPTALILCIIGAASKGLFQNIEIQLSSTT